jgi:SAM-dependent methyltransferase
MRRTADRQERIESVGFDYAAQPKNRVDRCNLCGGRLLVVVAHRDRYGYPASASACRACGLTFLSPVMTAAGYAAFYETTYRPLVSAYHGRLIDARTIQGEQREYAAERAALLEPYLADDRYRTLLDVGGSTGVVAHAFAKRFGLEPTLIDPSPLEVGEARQLGIEAIGGFVEDYDAGGRRFDVVLLCQTVDHLLDLAGTFRRVRELMAPHGILFVDIVDFRAAYLRSWSVEEAIKIDHPYYLTDMSMERCLSMTGFEVIATDYAADHLHVGYVCRPGSPVSDALPNRARVERLLEEIRFVQNAPLSR